jgi:hypothetical protein
MCPRCQYRYAVRDHQAGQRFNCETCGQRIEVPAPPPVLPATQLSPHATPSGKGLTVFASIVGIVCLLLLLAGIGVVAALAFFVSRPQAAKDSKASTGKQSPSGGVIQSSGGPAPSEKPATKPGVNQLPPIDIATKVHQIFRTYCYRCHGANGASEGGFNYVLDLEKLIARKKVLPKLPDKSKLYLRVKDGDMPPEDEKLRPTPDEMALLKQWIELGAPALPSSAQSLDLTSNASLIELIHTDLSSLPERDRRFTRFFTLTHLANLGLRNDELETYRVALAKLLNGLSWNKELFKLKAIDVNQTVFRVDIRDYQWSEGVWRLLTDAYPYGILWDHPQAKSCFEMVGEQLPMVRADWFLAQASKPPLYHDILQLPRTEPELEKQLHIDLLENIRQERVVRAGFNGSGVSRNNRLVERHSSPFGSYWRSYDFANNVGQRNLFAFPLGPGLGAKGFQPNGGEVIFSLPNGLNAYMLIDEKGNRLDKAPIAVVSDPKRPDRTVENGISCMSCHVRGLIPVKDQIRPHVEKNLASFSQQELETIKALYPSEERLGALMAKDNARFRASVEQLGGKLTAGDAITNLVAYYEQEVDLATAAAELGFRPDELSAKLAQSSSLLRVLGPLRVSGGTVQRQVFTESIPELVRELKLGLLLPLRP